jgi:hypothetical protein
MYMLSVSLAGHRLPAARNVGRLEIRGEIYPRDGKLPQRIHRNWTGSVAPRLLGSTSLALNMRIEEADP